MLLVFMVTNEADKMAKWRNWLTRQTQNLVAARL
jgi:hypothetical protein